MREAEREFREVLDLAKNANSSRTALFRAMLGGCLAEMKETEEARKLVCRSRRELLTRRTMDLRLVEALIDQYELGPCQ